MEYDCVLIGIPQDFSQSGAPSKRLSRAWHNTADHPTNDQVPRSTKQRQIHPGYGERGALDTKFTNFKDFPIYKISR
jgi:hypothetical protein